MGSNTLGDNKENTTEGNIMNTTYNANIVTAANRIITVLTIAFSALVLTAGALAMSSQASNLSEAAPVGIHTVAMSSVGNSGTLGTIHTSTISSGSGGSLAADTSN